MSTGRVEAASSGVIPSSAFKDSSWTGDVVGKAKGEVARGDGSAEKEENSLLGL